MLKKTLVALCLVVLVGCHNDVTIHTKALERAVETCEAHGGVFRDKIRFNAKGWSTIPKGQKRYVVTATCKDHLSIKYVEYISNKTGEIL